MNNITTFGELDQRALDQLIRCKEDGSPAVLCADHHVGYSQPIGGAVAYRNKISPSGVGYDIACGNKAAKTPLKAADVEVAGIMDEIFDKLSFGMGRTNSEDVSHPVLDEIKEASFAPQRQLYDLAAKQLGTIGSGNHYVDLFRDEDGYVWVGVHFGSRGFGHKTATGFMAIAQGKGFEDRPKGESMDAPPILFDADSTEGESYIEAMRLAGDYAYAGRDWVVEKVLSILGTISVEEIHNHHNFAWREEHYGENYWIVRKGCTPAFPEQRGFVGGTMGDVSVILEGVDGQEAKESLYSTVHGAGRVMSRTEAAGKKKWLKHWECSDRDCYRTFDTPQGSCPDHPDNRTLQRKAPRIVKPGKVDWPAVKEQLKNQGIELRGGGADEAPEAYKRLPDVLEAHKNSIKVLHTLRPLGVAMAGAEVYDPFKD